MAQTTSQKLLRSVSFDVSSSTGVQSAFQVGKAGSVAIPLYGSKATTKIIPLYAIARVSSIASSASKLTMAISSDASGDVLIYPDTQDTIALGKTTTTKGLASYAFDLPFIDTSGSEVTFYVFWKTDTGSLTVDSFELFYSQEQD
jgi:hypothetical protein